MALNKYRPWLLADIPAAAATSLSSPSSARAPRSGDERVLLQEPVVESVVGPLERLAAGLHLSAKQFYALLNLAIIATIAQIWTA